MAWIAGYADGLTYRPGDIVTVRTSTDAPEVTVDLVRLICGDVNPDGPGAEARLVEAVAPQVVAGREQAVHPGSYGRVPPSPGLAALGSFTVAAWVWPTALGRAEPQGLVSTATGDRGFALAIDATGLPTLRAGDAAVTGARPLKERQWSFVAATWSASTHRAELLVVSPEWPAQRQEAGGELRITPSAGPLVFAADRKSVV